MKFFFPPYFVSVNVLQVPFLLTDNSMVLQELLCKAAKVRERVDLKDTGVTPIYGIFFKCVIHSSPYALLISFFTSDGFMDTF